METITLGQIAAAVALIAGLITGASIILGNLKKWLMATLTEKFGAIEKRFDDLTERIDEVDINSTKNFLVRFLADAERHGGEVDPIALERFYEQYDHYLKSGGNSYIREKVNKLKQEGKL